MQEKTETGESVQHILSGNDEDLGSRISAQAQLIAQLQQENAALRSKIEQLDGKDSFQVRPAPHSHLFKFMHLWADFTNEMWKGKACGIQLSYRRSFGSHWTCGPIVNLSVKAEHLHYLEGAQKYNIPCRMSLINQILQLGLMTKKYH